MLLEVPPFAALYTTDEQPVKSKTPKETKAKNITFVPVPDSGKILSYVTCHYKFTITGRL